jgi:prephenate dehydratase
MAEEQLALHASQKTSSSTTPTTVAFLGPVATYTHQAALSYFGSSPTDKARYTLVPSATISSVFHTVRDSSASYGVVPYENSTNGAVAATLDLLADNESSSEEAVSRDLIVVGEVYVPVHHCLLGRKQQHEQAQQPHQQSSSNSPPSSTPPSTSTPYAHIKTLYSHPQAWGQCTHFLSQHLHHATRHDCTSTSRAAELAAEDQTGSSAAVSNFLAAEANGLDVLARNIVDDPEGNETRFLMLRRRRHRGGQGVQRDEKQQQQQQRPLSTAATTTLLTFVPKRSSPPSRDMGIVPILSLLQQQNSRAEITKFHSRPRSTTASVTGTGRKPWEYVYLVELRREGDRRRDDDNDDDGFGDDQYLSRLLSPSGDLGKLVENVRCLGVWED